MLPPSMEASVLEPWLRAPARQSPNSDEGHPHLLFHFPTPELRDEQELSMNHQVLFQNQMIPGSSSIAVDSGEKGHVEIKAKGKLMDPRVGKKMDPPLRRRNIGVAPRRRAGKKDRHSKICTAQGIRDRRMRLSLQAARKFFDLQDMLGYDKASKTIEWLFSKSKKAIKELSKGQPRVDSNVSNSQAKSESFVSDCDEVVSGVEESSNKDVKCVMKEETNLEKMPNVRESRDKARARARCRTKEKMMIRLSSQLPESTTPTEDEHLQKLGFSMPRTFAATPHDQEPSFTDQATILSYEQPPPDSGTLEKLLGIPSSSSAPFVDPNSNFIGFLTSWDCLSHERGGSSSCTVTDQITTAVYSSNP